MNEISLPSDGGLGQSGIFLPKYIRKRQENPSLKYQCSIDFHITLSVTTMLRSGAFRK